MKRYKIRSYSFIWAMSYIGPALCLGVALVAIYTAGWLVMGL